MKTELFYQACIFVDADEGEFIRQAYLYAEAPLPSVKKAKSLALDVLYEDEFQNQVLEDYILDVLALRAYPIKPKLIELRKAE